MALRDIFDYMRARGDERLRKQKYLDFGMGLLERSRRAGAYWAPHLERNRGLQLSIAQRLGAERGGTLLVLGAGRLLDVPWQEIFPRFERVVLFDADASTVPCLRRSFAAARLANLPQPAFEIGDLTESVVDLAAWAEHTLGAAKDPRAAEEALAQGFDQAGAPQPSWARAYADVRLAISTNLLSQLGYFPWTHIQSGFRKRFGVEFDTFEHAAERLERYFDRVRARHVQDLGAFKKAWVYLSTDIKIYTYRLSEGETGNLTGVTPPDGAGVQLGADLAPRFHWPVKLLEEWSPLHTQTVKELWPANAPLDAPQRWVWHIVPQGCDKKHRGHGRVHVVEAWTKRPG